MHGFDPRDWWWWRDTRDETPNRLLSCGLIGALCLCIASFAPPPLFLPVAAELLWMAALGSAAGAVLRGERVLMPQMTGWDEAAALAAAALLARLLAGLLMSAPPAA